MSGWRGLEPIWKNDLPEYFGPMAVKELRQSLRKASFVYPFLAIQLIAVLAVSYEFKIGVQTPHFVEAGMLNILMLFDSGPFWIVVGSICMVLMPLTGLLLMQQELEEGNHELLQLTELNRWGIVTGKFFSLWGLSVLTFFSLMPFVVVRYLVGGVEWWRELACAGTVLGGAAILSAVAIGASSYRRTAAKIGIFILLFGSLVLVCLSALGGSAMATRGCGWHYHFTALFAVICCVIQGLALARARLRLAMHVYEVQPSGLIIGWLIFQPFVIGIITAISLGWLGFLALIGAAILAMKIDLSPKAPKWVTPPQPNVPTLPPA